MKIRVAQIVAGISIGDSSGGAEYFGVQLARHLDSIQYDKALFSMWRYSQPVEEIWLEKLIKENIFTDGFYPLTSTPLRDLLPIVKRLWDFVTQWQPDILVSHNQRSDIITLLIKIFHPHKVRFIRVKHVDSLWMNSRGLDLLFDKCLLALYVDHDIAVSRSIQDKLRARLVAKVFKKTPSVCFNALDPIWFDDLEIFQIPRDIPKSKPRIGIIGRLTRQKGHRDFLQAIVYLKNFIPDFSVLIIGSGELMNHLKHLCKQWNLNTHVYFLGSRTDIREILHFLDILVSPSLWEGLPTSILEAMSQGVPIVATNISGNNDLIIDNETGYLVTPACPMEMAEKILEVLNNPDKTKTMVINAKEKSKNYSMIDSAACHSEIYKKLMLYYKSSSR